MNQTNKRVFLTAVMLSAVLVGTVSMLVPALRQKREQEGQNALLARLEQNAAACGQLNMTEADGLERSEQENTDRSLTVSTGLDRMIPAKNMTGGGENTMFFMNHGTEGAVTAADTEMTNESKATGTTAEPMPEAGSEIGILTIPKIGAKLPVTAGVTEEQLKISEGWVMQTAPIGSVGNAVVAGHRSYTWGRHFNRIDELEPGDEIFYTRNGGEIMCFVVSETLTVEPDDPAVFAAPPAGMAQLTLYTCTPVRIATHRLIVRALLEE